MADHILQEAETSGLKRYWLSSEGWNPHILNVDAPENQLYSVLTVSIKKGEELPEFVTYLRDIVTRDHYCDIWLHTFIEQRFCCISNETKNGYIHGKNCHNESKVCSIMVSTIADDIIKETPSQVNNLIDSVYTVAYAIKLVVERQCSTSTGTCIPRISVNELTDAIKNVSFTNFQNRTVSFEESGDLKQVSYTIENIQKVDGEWKYKKVGDWVKTRSQTLKFDVNNVKWPKWFMGTSECSIQCLPGEYVVGKQGCCWDCETCNEKSASNISNAEKCTKALLASILQIKSIVTKQQ